MTPLAKHPPESQLPAKPVNLLTPRQARTVKLSLIERFCRVQLSAQAVEKAFSLFPELKGA
jgi:hypothetical protein